MYFSSIKFGGREIIALVPVTFGNNHLQSLKHGIASMRDVPSSRRIRRESARIRNGILLASFYQ